MCQYNHERKKNSDDFVFMLCACFLGIAAGLQVRAVKIKYMHGVVTGHLLAQGSTFAFLTFALFMLFRSSSFSGRFRHCTALVSDTRTKRGASKQHRSCRFIPLPCCAHAQKKLVSGIHTCFACKREQPGYLKSKTGFDILDDTIWQTT